jgi:type VI secretion system secreted protein VgrG
VILGSAPKGIALVSGEDMQFSASDNLTLTAGKQLDIGAQKDFTMAAGKQLSLYSRGGVKLFSSQNDIDIQAQGGISPLGRRRTRIFQVAENGHYSTG